MEHAPSVISSTVVAYPSCPHPVELPAQSRGLRDRVLRDPGQVGQDLRLHVPRSMGEQHLGDAGGVHRQSRPDGADHRHRRTRGEQLDVEHLGPVTDREVHRDRGQH
jgi:hypothetical protein